MMDLRLARKWNSRNRRKEYAIASFFGENFSMAVFWFGDVRPTPVMVQSAMDMLSQWEN